MELDALAPHVPPGQCSALQWFQSGLKRGLRDNTEAFATEARWMEKAHLDERAIGAVILVRGEHAIWRAVEIPGFPVPTGFPAPGAQNSQKLQPPRSRGPEEPALHFVAHVVCIRPVSGLPRAEPGLRSAMTPATEGPDQGLGELTNLHQQLDGPGVKITVGQAPGNAVMLKPLIAGQSHRSEVENRSGCASYRRASARP